MKKICMFFLTFLVAQCLATSAIAQVLLNSGFETGALSPWFQDRDFAPGEENWHVTAASPHSGAFAATGIGNKEIRQNFAPVPTNSIQHVSFWARHETTLVDLLAVDFFYSDSTTNEFHVSTQTTNYEFFDVTSHLTAGKQLVGFSIFGNANGRTFIDDATIAVPEPSSLLLAGF